MHATAAAQAGPLQSANPPAPPVVTLTAVERADPATPPSLKRLDDGELPQTPGEIASCFVWLLDHRPAVPKRPDCAKLLLSALSTAGVDTLDLSGKTLDGANLFRLAGLLEAGIAFSHLVLEDCRLTDASALAIGRLLGANSTVRRLSLARNALSDATGAAVAQALFVNASLVELDLAGNQLGIASAAALWSAICRHKGGDRKAPGNRTLQTLSLNDNAAMFEPLLFWHINSYTGFESSQMADAELPYPEPITQAQEQAISQLRGFGEAQCLRKLSLRNTRLVVHDEFLLNTFGTFGSLASIDLSCNYWIDDRGLGRLQRAMRGAVHYLHELDMRALTRQPRHREAMLSTQSLRDYAAVLVGTPLYWIGIQSVDIFSMVGCMDVSPLNQQQLDRFRHEWHAASRPVGSYHTSEPRLARMMGICLELDTVRCGGAGKFKPQALFERFACEVLAIKALPAVADCGSIMYRHAQLTWRPGEFVRTVLSLASLSQRTSGRRERRFAKRSRMAAPPERGRNIYRCADLSSWCRPGKGMDVLPKLMAIAAENHDVISLDPFASSEEELHTFLIGASFADKLENCRVEVGGYHFEWAQVKEASVDMLLTGAWLGRLAAQIASDVVPAPALAGLSRHLHKASKYVKTDEPLRRRALALLEQVLARGWPEERELVAGFRAKIFFDIDREGGQSPLMVACEMGYPRMAALLLKTGASPDRLYEGRAPLHAACAAGHLAVVRVLLEAKVDRHVRTATGETASDLARQSPRSAAQILALLEVPVASASAALAGTITLPEKAAVMRIVPSADWGFLFGGSKPPLQWKGQRMRARRMKRNERELVETIAQELLVYREPEARELGRAILQAIQDAGAGRAV